MSVRSTVRHVRAYVQFADVVIGTLAAVLCRTLLERTQMVHKIPGTSH